MTDTANGGSSPLGVPTWPWWEKRWRRTSAAGFQGNDGTNEPSSQHEMNGLAPCSLRRPKALADRARIFCAAAKAVGLFVRAVHRFWPISFGRCEGNELGDLVVVSATDARGILVPTPYAGE